ncbi:hypothetical protein PAXRUDRAFT_288511 [Paxillus rubicundulus Ve08.2h10]|uniref:Uncharacterized protein n=1 Tax=Paxillus rubicundulus Ve08.2h10 TaxID=930991 RepID=A0A0D0CUX7_9AGAM|nr:hypothetical protein PAXRUDRAFT_288511 [Paxillus rubicundulus Ve08.2h10]
MTTQHLYQICFHQGRSTCIQPNVCAPRTLAPALCGLHSPEIPNEIDILTDRRKSGRNAVVSVENRKGELANTFFSFLLFSGGSSSICFLCASYLVFISFHRHLVFKFPII